MTHFDLFSGYGGFSLALEKVYGNNRNINVSQERGGEETSQENEQEVWQGLYSIPSKTALSSKTNSDEHANRSVNERQLDGVQTIGFSEIDKYASAVLKYHWPKIKNYGDIKSIDARSLPDFELLTGGFPCQSFSIAGKRGGFEDTRGTLAFDMLNIAKEKTPKYILAENVKGLMSHDNGKTLQTILASFQELGYTISIEILNAKNYGVPQNRERIFILGMHIPTICKEIVNTGFQAKTDTSVKIIKGFLSQSLLNNLTEVQKLQETASKDLVCGLMVLSVITNGLKEKLTFSKETYKNHWQSFVGLSLKEMREQFITRPGNSEEKLNTKDGILSTEESISLSEETKLWQSIEKLWQILWEEVCQAQNRSTTSTAILQTIDKKTFTYAEMLLTIVSFIIQLRNLSSHLWNEVLLDLIVLKGNTFYEPITNQTEERIIGRSCFIRRSNLSSSQQPNNCFVIGFRDGSPREVFFERNSTSEDNGKLCPTIRATHYKSGDNQPLIKQLPITRGRSTEPWKVGMVPPSRRLSDKDDIKIMVPEATQIGYAIAEPGDSINLSVIDSKTRRGRIGHGIANTLDTRMQQHTIQDTRIRRLTPTECERLMGLPDGWASKGIMNDNEVEISDSQRYKLCGNGVVVNVVEEIIKQIIL